MSFIRSFQHASIRASLLAIAVSAPQSPAIAQMGEMPPAPVQFTEAREHPVQGAVRLTGSVESPTVSIVASEVEGAVIEIRAKEGDRVERNQPLARLRTTSLELERASVEAQLGEVGARLRQAETHLQRAEELLQDQLIPPDQYDDRLYEVTAWKSRVAQLTAEIAVINEDIERSTVRAPFGGVVLSKHTEAGQWLSVGAPVAEIALVDELEVQVEVPERYYRDLSISAAVTVTLDALPGFQAAGRIRAIIPTADTQARTFPVKITIPNPDRRIAAGMVASVSFPIGRTYNATIVPKDAVVRQGPQQVVYVINDAGTVDLLPVETGQAAGAWVEIRGPVEAGQKVVTRGNERLRPGQAVQPQAQEYPLP